MNFLIKTLGIALTEEKSDGSFPVVMYFPTNDKRRSHQRLTVRLPQTQITFWPGQTTSVDKMADVMMQVKFLNIEDGKAVVKLVGCLDLNPTFSKKKVMVYPEMFVEEGGPTQLIKELGRLTANNPNARASTDKVFRVE